VILEALLDKGNGWEELQYITRDSTNLGFQKTSGYLVYMYLSISHPDALLERDGADSNATVAVYQANEDKAIGAPFTADNCRALEPETVKPPPLEIDDFWEDPELVEQAAEGREMLVVAKRGQGANIVEQDIRPYGRWDIRQWAEGMTWPEIKRDHHLYLRQVNDADAHSGSEGGTFEVDSYERIDEYVWDNL
jgi:hypothetical protein